MTEGNRPAGGDDGILALNQVLEAETHAEQAVEQARATAAQIVTAARHEAADIASRGDARVQALHKCARRKLKERRRALQHDFQQEQSTTDLELGDAALDDLVARLARQLTGQPGG